MISIKLNGELTQVSDGLLLEGLLAQLQIDSKGIALALNGLVVPRSQWTSRQLTDQDVVDIFQSIAGG